MCRGSHSDSYQNELLIWLNLLFSRISTHAYVLVIPTLCLIDMLQRNFVTFLFSTSVWREWTNSLQGESPSTGPYRANIAWDLYLWNHKRPGQALLILSWFLILWMTGVLEVLDAQSETFIPSINTELLTDVFKCVNRTIDCHLIHWGFFMPCFMLLVLHVSRSGVGSFFFFLVVVVENNYNFAVKKFPTWWVDLIRFTCSLYTARVEEKKSCQICTLWCWLASVTTQDN